MLVIPGNQPHPYTYITDILCAHQVQDRHHIECPGVIQPIVLRGNSLRARVCVCVCVWLCGFVHGRQIGWPLLQFVSRPFVVGDRVELRTSSGSSVVVGLVERISPMSTTIRNDHSIPISIPNK